MNEIRYESLERLRIQNPVDRLDFISDLCTGKVVLDIGCLDETALRKRDTKHWLHGRISTVASHVIGIDNSDLIPSDGITTSERSIIMRGDGVNPSAELISDRSFDLIIAGEFIEHLECPMEFLRNMKRQFPGRELIFSTPNGVCFANTFMGAMGREVQHKDHVANFTFKIINTLCVRAGFESWEIRPYRFYATEMILQSKGLKKLTAIGVERTIRIVEWMFPLLSFGYIVKVRL